MLENINTVIWCLPRTGSHNLTRRVHNTYIKNNISVGWLGEMFPDYHPLIHKEALKEHEYGHIVDGSAHFSLGYSWVQQPSGYYDNQLIENWNLHREINHRLSVLDCNTKPHVGKHLMWQTTFLEEQQPGYAERVHKKVAGFADRIILLWRKDLVKLLASNELLSWGWQNKAAGNIIPSHGDIKVTDLVTPTKQEFDKHCWQVERFITRFIDSLKYVDKNRAVMIETTEIDSTVSMTFPDGFVMPLSLDGFGKHRNTYKISNDTGTTTVSGPLDILTNSDQIRDWADEMESKYKWSQLPETFGFSSP